MYLTWFYNNLAYNPFAITQDDINEFVSHYSAPGAMRAGFEYYRAFPQDAIENQNYSKTKTYNASTGGIGAILLSSIRR